MAKIVQYIFSYLLVLVVCCVYGKTNYLLYSVKNGEGFNLRRDVHMRAASLVRMLHEQQPTGSRGNWILVLPPWPWLYHWKTTTGQIPFQPWSKFFDVPSLNQFVPTIELDEYLDRNGHVLNEVMVLQNFEGKFTTENFGRIDEQPCLAEQYKYKERSDGSWKGNVFGRKDISISKYHCFSTMGHISMILPHLNKMTGNSILVENFEILLHERFGSEVYWQSRYSMVYAAHLRQTGDEFMKTVLHYRPEDGGRGRDPARDGGGDYIAVHLRRQDYLYAHKDVVPSLEGAASQLNTLKKELRLERVFLASDASLEDKLSLQRMVKGLVWYTPSDTELRNYGDGGVAIIDQWVAAHAKYFLGTPHSTFSFRIREDRQFLGFSKEATFNDVCGPSDNEHDHHSCKKPSYWKWEGGPPELLHDGSPSENSDRDEL